MGVTVTVLVPTDRVAAFQSAFGCFAAGGSMPAPTAGSAATSWADATVVIPSDRVAAFYTAFGDWIAAATAAAPVDPSLPALTIEDVLNDVAAWAGLPRHEQELLHLLTDDDRGAVGWPELRRKLALPEPVSVARVLPELAALCAARQRAVPVVVEGDGDAAVLSVTPEQLSVVRAVAEARPPQPASHRRQ